VNTWGTQHCGVPDWCGTESNGTWSAGEERISTHIKPVFNAFLEAEHLHTQLCVYQCHITHVVHRGGQSQRPLSGTHFTNTVIASRQVSSGSQRHLIRVKQHWSKIEYMTMNCEVHPTSSC